MAYVPSHLEVCPFWVNKTDNLETYCVILDGPTGILDNPFPNPDGSSYTDFGESIAISDSYSLIGAKLNNGLGDVTTRYVGAAYVFNNSTGKLLHILTSPNPEYNGKFGSSVDVCESYSIVGASDEDNNSIEDGGVYLFSNTTGLLLHSFINPTPAGYDHWGSLNSIAVNESYSVVGYKEYWASIFIGEVKIYDNLTGNLITTIDNPETNQQFGIAVYLGDDYLVVSTYRGKVFVFNTGDWSLRWSLSQPIPDIWSHYGVNVAVNDLYIAVTDGAYNTSQGVVYIFDNLTGLLLHELTAPNPENYINFGRSVDMSGSQVIIGTEENRHKAYLYDMETGAFIRELSSPDTYPDATYPDGFFGYSVSISTAYSLVGAYEYLNESLGRRTGRAYIFTDHTTVEGIT